ncbi:MAG: hypothetical protein AUH25_01610 [Thaumarchaeota archaeon 13_1_40CM_38_12]|nr:MAG: hypothetical protein AUH25_01610 [Thaumarchaeota archaeon 13_1_40CM_38_12]OLC33603.1 MAG: hypothetical protein AUH84_06765 [Thaumarchaeota archaeon 13_1_40CM_4_38_7]OLD30264.1 MAG: hypothetical protein AUI62_01640 [Thaumarchaeota archaeon 13_1_40CM_2_39_7]
MPKLRRKAISTEKQVYYPKKSRTNAFRILKLLAQKGRLSTKQIAADLGTKWAYPHRRIKSIMTELEELGYCDEYRLILNTNALCESCKESKRFLVKGSSLSKGLETLANNIKFRDEASKKEGFDPTQWFSCKSGHVLGQLISPRCFACDTTVMGHFQDEYKILQDRYWTLSNNGKLALFLLLKSKSLSNFIAKNIDHKIIELVDVLLKSQKKDLVKILYYNLQQTTISNPNLQKVANDWYIETRNKILDMKLDEIDNPLSEYKNKYRYAIFSENVSRQNSSINL